MGLDGVELILAVEDAFYIAIADEEASNISTVGDLSNLVVAKLQGQATKSCLTSTAFYRTRRGIMDALGMERRQIRPSTPLQSILPRNGRRGNWRHLQKAMKLQLPDLRHPGWIQLSLLATGIALAMTPVFYGRVSFWAIPLLVLLGLVFGGLLLKFSSPLAVAFPNGNVTVGDLVRDVLALNHAHLADDVGGWNERSVWESLCRVIVIQTGVAPEKITPGARIVDDLGID